MSVQQSFNDQAISPRHRIKCTYTLVHVYKVRIFNLGAFTGCLIWARFECHCATLFPEMSVLWWSLWILFFLLENSENDVMLSDIENKKKMPVVCFIFFLFGVYCVSCCAVQNVDVMCNFSLRIYIFAIYFIICIYESQWILVANIFCNWNSNH